MKQAKLSFARDFQIGEIDPRIYGSFLEHLGRAIYGGIYEPGHPTADANGFRRDVLDLIAQLNVPMVRYPGGNFVSGYHWEDGVGPREARPKKLELAWQATESNQFGTNEFMDWCRAANTEPMMAVNLGLRGAQEARNLLEYCNHPGGSYWSDLRRAHGWEKPHGVKLWCLGNEMDGPWQIGAKTVQEYTRLATETAKVMKWTDPSIELVVCGSSHAGMPTFGEWELSALEAAWDNVDYVSLHQYFGKGESDSANFLAKSVFFDHYIESVAGLCRYVKAKRRSKHSVYLSVDEWNVWHHSGAPNLPGWQEAPSQGEDIYNFEDALLVGLMLITLLKHSDSVKVACLAQLVNVIAPILTETGGKAWVQPTFYPYMHVSNYGKGKALIPVMDSPMHDTKEFTDVPDVDSVAVWDEETAELTIFAVNRNQTEEIALDVKLLDFTPLQPTEYLVMAGFDPLQTHIRDAQPVKPISAPLPQLENNQASVLLKPLSWNVLRFKG